MISILPYMALECSSCVAWTGCGVMGRSTEEDEEDKVAFAKLVDNEENYPISPSANDTNTNHQNKSITNDKNNDTYSASLTSLALSSRANKEHGDEQKLLVHLSPEQQDQEQQVQTQQTKQSGDRKCLSSQSPPSLSATIKEDNTSDRIKQTKQTGGFSCVTSQLPLSAISNDNELKMMSNNNSGGDNRLTEKSLIFRRIPSVVSPYSNGGMPMNDQDEKDGTACGSPMVSNAIITTLPQDNNMQQLVASQQQQQQQENYRELSPSELQVELQYGPSPQVNKVGSNNDPPTATTTTITTPTSISPDVEVVAPPPAEVNDVVPRNTTTAVAAVAPHPTLTNPIPTVLGGNNNNNTKKLYQAHSIVSDDIRIVFQENATGTTASATTSTATNTDFNCNKEYGTESKNNINPMMLTSLADQKDEDAMDQINDAKQEQLQQTAKEKDDDSEASSVSFDDCILPLEQLQQQQQLLLLQQQQQQQQQPHFRGPALFPAVVSILPFAATISEGFYCTTYEEEEEADEESSSDSDSLFEPMSSPYGLDFIYSNKMKKKHRQTLKQRHDDIQNAKTGIYRNHRGGSSSGGGNGRVAPSWNGGYGYPPGDEEQYHYYNNPQHYPPYHHHPQQQHQQHYYPMRRMESVDESHALAVAPPTSNLYPPYPPPRYYYQNQHPTNEYAVNSKNNHNHCHDSIVANTIPKNHVSNPSTSATTNLMSQFWGGIMGVSNQAPTNNNNGGGGVPTVISFETKKSK